MAEERGQATLRTLSDLSAVVEEEGVVKVLMESGLGDGACRGRCGGGAGPTAPSLASAAGRRRRAPPATSHPLQSLLHPVPPAPPAALLRGAGPADAQRGGRGRRATRAGPGPRSAWPRRSAGCAHAGAEFAAWVFCHAALADPGPRRGPSPGGLSGAGPGRGWGDGRRRRRGHARRGPAHLHAATACPAGPVIRSRPCGQSPAATAPRQSAETHC